MTTRLAAAAQEGSPSARRNAGVVHCERGGGLFRCRRPRAPDQRQDRRRTRGTAAISALVVALIAIALTPDTAWAWTPGTHVFLGEAVLRALHLLPPHAAQLIAAFPLDFLYGSIAADTSIAKKYAAAGRHCHSWKVGLEIHGAAREEPLQAFGFGYLAHLAADVVAHNFFVPRQLTVTSSTAALGHSYWESRFEMHLPEGFSTRAHALVMRDHSRADAHLDRILAPTLFSTPTNRRIFRGMVRAIDSESWQRIFQLMLENSRWDFPEGDAASYINRSFDYIVDLLWRIEESEPYRYDPAGRGPLRLSKRVRRWTLKRANEERVPYEAERYFGLPESPLEYARSLNAPLIEVVRG